MELRDQTEGEVPTMVPSLPEAKSDPDLACLNATWPTLPLYIKSAILALIGAACVATQTSPTDARSSPVSRCSGEDG